MSSYRIVIVLSIILLSVSCVIEPKKALESTLPDQKWTWSVERFEAAVNQVRAGQDLTPSSWPNDARVAVLLSFDVDRVSIHSKVVLTSLHS